MSRSEIVCAACGQTFIHARRGRPPLTHKGSCRQLRRNEVDEERRDLRYKLALSNASVLQPLVPVSHVELEGGEGDSLATRLGSAGFAEPFNDEHEFSRQEKRLIGPGYERLLGYYQHRDAALSSLRADEPQVDLVALLPSNPPHPATSCRGCRQCLGDLSDSYTMSDLHRLMIDWDEDAALRERIKENDLSHLISEVPNQ